MNSSTSRNEQPQAWADDVPLRGEHAPKNDGQAKYLIEYLLTVYKRFGNTAVTCDLQWGAAALHKRDEQKERIAELERQLALARSEIASLGGDKEQLSRAGDRTDDKNHEFTNDDLIRMWKAAGGSFYGPHVEHGTMPAVNLFRFLREMAGLSARSAAPCIELTAEQVKSYCDRYRHVVRQDEDAPTLIRKVWRDAQAAQSATLPSRARDLLEQAADRICHSVTESDDGRTDPLLADIYEYLGRAESRSKG